MSVKIDTHIEALGDLQKFFERLPQQATAAARMAINDVVTRDGFKLIQGEINADVNFPVGYLEGDRLFVQRKATNNDLTAVIVGRDRPTSLARFAPSKAKKQPGGVTVEVHRGKAKVMRRAFIVSLKRGSAATGNFGLAIKLKKGEVVKGTTRALLMKKISEADEDYNYYLLYGPSVEQVFSDVADDVSQPIANMIKYQFLRQFARLTDG